MNSLKTAIKNITPSFIRHFYSFVRNNILYNYIVPYKQKKAISQLSHKEDPIRCVFLALFDSVWKYDGVFKLLHEDSRFDPIILVCPVVNYGYENMINTMNDCYNFFKNKGYNVVLSYDLDNNSFLNLRKDLKPDILFYTSPYKGLIDHRYYVDKFSDILSVYVPYCAQEGIPTEMDYNLDSHNRFWRYYTLSSYHKKYSHDLAVNKGRNVKVTGYPQIELFSKENYEPSSKCWKQNDTTKKRIIWAPHHTLEAAGTVDYSTFSRYSDFIIKMVEKYEDKVQWVFKPHPILRNKLEKLWGKEKTDSYYSKWDNMRNASLINGDYVDLFLTSDAMIHDSGSFVLEYLYVDKPVLRPLNNIPLNELYNQFGLDCLDNYYFANTEDDIEQFICMVINGDDPLKEQRTSFVNDTLNYTNGLTPSQIIIEDILYSIKHKKVFVD